MQRLAQGGNAVNVVISEIDGARLLDRSRRKLTGAKCNLMGFRPEQVNGHWYIQYPLAVFAWEPEKTT